MRKEIPYVDSEPELALFSIKSTRISNSLVINNGDSDQQLSYVELEETESESDVTDRQQVSFLTSSRIILNLILLFRNVLMKMFYFTKNNIADIYVTFYSRFCQLFLSFYSVLVLTKSFVISLVSI
jgi:hypothetical protein